MTGVLKSKKFLIGLTVVLVVGGTVVIILAFRSKPVAETKTTQADISTGACSDATYDNLIEVRDGKKKSGDKAGEGAALERIGLCFIYRQKSQDALPWFKEAKQVFDDAKLADDARRVQNSIDAIKAESNRAPADTPDTQLDGNE